MRTSAWTLSALAIAACRPGNASDPPDAPASPQAKAEPAPLANTPPTTSAAFDAGPPPAPLRGDQDLAADTVPRDSSRDGGPPSGKEPWRAGWSISAILRASDVPGPPKAPEVNQAAIDAARKKVEPRMKLELSASRLRVELASDGFVLPPGTELRARADRYGHLLFWPDESTYRIVEPGALRALLGERRLDVAPLAAADVDVTGPGPRRLDLPTRRYEVVTRAAKATFDMAPLKDSGEGGALVCRMLLDVIGGAPSASVCAPDQVPLFAELRWTTRGALTFEAQAIGRRTDLSAQDLATPPPGYAFVAAPPAQPAAEAMLSRVDLSAFRGAAVEPPPPAPVGDGQAPKVEGLVLANSTDELRVVMIDGVAVEWLAPGARVSFPWLPHGRYVVQWRTFLGDAFEPPQMTSVPGTSEVGAVDAGP